MYEKDGTMRLLLGLCFLFVAVVTSTSCAKDPVRDGESNNPNVPVSVLFDYDGCRVYRFKDAGHFIYYAKCGVVTQTTWEQSEGKTSRPMHVSTESRR